LGTGWIGPLQILMLAVLLLLSPVLTIQTRAAYFSDDMEGAAKWTADPPWAITTLDKHSGAQAWTDSPAGYYGNLTDASLTLTTPLDLTGAISPQLVFWHNYQIETDFDFGYVELSNDGGANWPHRLATITASPLETGTGRSDPLSGDQRQDRFRLVTTRPWSGALDHRRREHRRPPTPWPNFRSTTPRSPP
jgi:hypothetical protein